MQGGDSLLPGKQRISEGEALRAAQKLLEQVPALKRRAPSVSCVWTLTACLSVCRVVLTHNCLRALHAPARSFWQKT